MDDITIVLLVAFGFGAVFGTLTARSSHRREPIRGGVLSQALNLLAASLLVAALPAVLTAVVVGVGFRVGLPLAIALIFGSYLVLCLYALVEKPHLATPDTEDRGWTEEDARTSGL